MTPFVAEVLSNEAAGSAFRKLVVSAPQAFEENVCPGQFAHIKRRIQTISFTYIILVMKNHIHIKSVQNRHRVDIVR